MAVIGRDWPAASVKASLGTTVKGADVAPIKAVGSMVSEKAEALVTVIVRLTLVWTTTSPKSMSCGVTVRARFSPSPDSVIVTCGIFCESVCSGMAKVCTPASAGV